MRTLLILLLGCSVCLGQTFSQSLAFRGAAVPKVGSTGPNIFTNDFESGTLPSGWTGDNVTQVYNYNNPAILGTYSLGFDSTGVAHVHTTTNSEIFLYFQLRFTNAPSALTQLATLVGDNGNTSINYLYVQADGRLSIYDHGFGHSAITVSTMSANTTYHVWAYYKAGSGANQLASIAFATTAVEPTSGNNFASFSNGVDTLSVDTYEFRGFLNWTIYDHIAGSTSDMPTGW